jgi:protein O-mannosyl-transferase
MKTKKREQRREATVVKVRARTPQAAKWPYIAAVAAAIVVSFWAYSPALHGPFLFDDTALPFALPGFTEALPVWLRGVRPALMFTYWVNATISHDDPFSYHIVNVIFHWITSALIFMIVRRLSEWAGIDASLRNLLAGFAAALFLLHPVQTEAVAYLAGRSDGLSVMLALAAFAVFLYRRHGAASWIEAAAVLALFAIGVLAKQDVIALPALLLLTDYWWNPGFSFAGIRSNWRVYVPLVFGAAVAVASFWKIIMHAETAGFGLKDFTWYQYFFTQCRALFVYPAIFLLPANLTADWDFAISRNVIDHGAVAGLIALVILAIVAWRYRRRFPLASYGFFAYLVLMAPTSSILPIKDPVAERRLYFSMLGLLLIVVDLLSRLKIERKVLAGACVAVALLASGVTRARAAVWADPIALWQDTAQKSPNKWRVRFQLAATYLFAGQYSQAAEEFAKAATLAKPDHNLLVDWGLAYDGLNRMDDALAKLRQAAALEPTPHVYTQIAEVYAKRGHYPEALDALTRAEELDGSYPPIYVYRGNIYFNTRQFDKAIPQYQRALQFNPNYQEALQNLLKAQRLLSAPR